MLCHTWVPSGKAPQWFLPPQLPSGCGESYPVFGSIQVDRGEEWLALFLLVLQTYCKISQEAAGLQGCHWLPCSGHTFCCMSNGILNTGVHKWPFPFFFFSEDSVWPVCSVVCRTLKGRYSKDLPALFEEPLVYGLLVDNEENEIPGESSPSLMTSKRVLEPSPFHKTWACEVRGQEARHSFHSPAWVCSTWGIQETQVTSAAVYLSLLALKITPKSNGLSQRPFSTFHTSRSAIKQASTMRTLLCRPRAWGWAPEVLICAWSVLSELAEWH